MATGLAGLLVAQRFRLGLPALRRGGGLKRLLVCIFTPLLVDKQIHGKRKPTWLRNERKNKERLNDLMTGSIAESVNQ